MKRRRHHQNRHKPRPQMPRQPAARVDSKPAGPRRYVWFAGLGVLLVIGVFLLPKHHAQPPVVPDSTVAVDSNPNPPPAAAIAQSLAGTTATMPATPTNRPGAAKNRESEGYADDLNNEGAKLLENGDPKEAVKVFQKAVAANPKDETFHFNLGLAYSRSGDLTNAEAQYKESLRLLPDYPEANNNYGNLLAHNGRMAEAEKYLAEALKEMPESAAYNNNFAVLERRLGKTNESLQLFQKAVECDSNYMEAHFNLAQAYLRINQRDKCIAELHEVLRIKPGFEPAEQALARVTGTQSSLGVPAPK